MAPCSHPALQVVSLQLSVVAFTVPLATGLPQALLSQLLAADLAARQCRLECAGLGWAAACSAGQGAAGGAAALGGAAPSCPSAAQDAALWYSTVVGAIRQRVPGSGAARGALPLGEPGWARSTCLGRCFAAHTWIQVMRSRGLD